MARVTLRHIEKNYGKGAPSVITGLDLDIPDGEFLCVLGPSGCGKTTTLRMIAGLEHPTAGSINVGERVVDDVARGIHVPPEQRQMGLVFQSYALWPHLSVQDNVEFGLRLRKLATAERESRATAVMQTLGIAAYAKRYPSELSGGQQQRVALARMLVMRPEVILLDEPLSNLDAKLRLEMRAELKRIHAETNATVVFVTHDQWEAMTLATTIAVMQGGQVLQLDTPDAIYERPTSRFVAEFIGSSPINMVELGAQGEATALSAAMGAYLQQRLTTSVPRGSVGIRPEALQFARQGEAVPAQALAGEAIVTGILPTGGSWIVELETTGRKLFMIAGDAPV
ncbi:MAG: ABC transporter ATP-binding protein, partial [Pseudomonadota bacterium]|nr:ABC transporter ATP-binding protein [Pseudomonadota bacterium]